MQCYHLHRKSNDKSELIFYPYVLKSLFQIQQIIIFKEANNAIIDVYIAPHKSEKSPYVHILPSVQYYSVQVLLD